MKKNLNILLGLCLGVLLSTTYFHRPQIKAKLTELRPIPVPQGVSYEFRHYVKDFLVGAKAAQAHEFIVPRLSFLTVKFGPVKDLDAGYAGFCEHHTNTVIIDEKLWQEMDRDSKQAIIDHELGHCLALRIHRHHSHLTINGTVEELNVSPLVLKQMKIQADKIGSPLDLQDLRPTSIMYPVMATSEYYRQNKAALRKELFSPERYDLMPKLLTAMTDSRMPQLFKIYASPETVLNIMENTLNNENHENQPQEMLTALIPEKELDSELEEY